FLLSLPGLFLSDAVIGLWDWIQDTRPAGSDLLGGGAGSILALLWPFGIPTGYALATVIPWLQPWMQWGVGLRGFIVWCMLTVLILYQHTLAAKP
ncbi:MAG: hypothetical protein Q6K12_08575, partial [Gloeomargarita sp. DG_1_6_bins_138]